MQSHDHILSILIIRLGNDPPLDGLHSRHILDIDQTFIHLRMRCHAVEPEE